MKIDRPVRRVGRRRSPGRWGLGLEIPAGPQALHLRIARAVAADIARGRLSRGQRLPGSRALADSIGVHRNTALAAYRELASQGWIRTEAARGTFVEGPLEDRRSMPTPRGRELAIDLPPANDPRFGRPLPPIMSGAEDGRALLLTGGRPDPRLFPVELLARAYRRVLRREGRRLLDYGHPHGHERLREQLAAMLHARRGLAITPGELLVTRGSQLALTLIPQALLSPGQRIAVESYGYPLAWASFRAAGLEIVPLPVDEQGLDVDALEVAHASAPIAAVYVTPHHQYATGVTLSAARRLQLSSFARAARCAILEDDYDHEYHYEGKPVLPLASTDSTVIYIGSLSKVLAPGLRVGYVAAPAPVIERLARMRTYFDRQGDLPTEAALADLLEDGEIQRHIWRTRRVYRARRDALAEALARELGERVQVSLPRGGIAMWVHTRGIDVDRWLRESMARGVYFVSGREIRYDGKKSSHARMGFARHDERELGEAVRRLRIAADAARV